MRTRTMLAAIGIALSSPSPLLTQSGVGTRAAINRTPPLSTKDSYGRFDDDASVMAAAHLATDSNAKYLLQL